MKNDVWIWTKVSSKTNEDGSETHVYNVSLNNQLVGEAILTKSSDSWQNGDGLPYSGQGIAKLAWQENHKPK